MDVEMEMEMVGGVADPLSLSWSSVEEVLGGGGGVIPRSRPADLSRGECDR